MAKQSFNELRKIKDRLPSGSMKKIAESWICMKRLSETTSEEQILNSDSVSAYT